MISCEFSPSGEYFVELDEPTDAPELEIELNLADTEKVIFYWDSQIKIGIKNTNIRLHDVSFFLDGQELNSSNDGTYFYTYVRLDDTEEHTFRMVLITSSGSNSLADAVGNEGFVYQSREWTLVHSNYNLYDNGNTSLNAEGSYVSWKAFDGVGLDHYKVLKSSTNIEYTFTDNQFQDNEYLGENCTYFVYVVDVDGEETMWAKCQIYGNLPVMKIIEKDKKPALTWSVTGFENKIASYKIYSKPFTGSYTLLDEVSTDVNSIILNGFVHGESYEFKLEVIPVKDYNITNIGSFMTTWLTDVGIPGPEIDDIHGNCSKGFIYEYKDTEIFYSAAEHDFKVLLKDDKSYFSTVSPNLEYFLMQKEALELYSVENLELIKSIDMKEHISDYNPFRYPKISDNGIVVISYDTTIYVYDMINENMIAEKSYEKYYYPVISPDGKYLILYSGKDLITNEITENSIVELNRITKIEGYYYYDDFLLIPDEPDKVYSINNQNLTVLSMIDYSEQRKFYFGSYKYFGGIDFSNDKFLIYDIDEFFIYSFNNGNLLEIVPHRVYTSSNSMVFCNNIIFTYGYKYYLSDYFL